MPRPITPNLWFAGNANEAVEGYVSIFPDSRIVSTTTYPETADDGLADFQTDLAGKVLTVDFVLGGQPFTAINAGPEFAPNPSISFIVNFDPSRDGDARAHLEEMWDRLIDGGEALMPLDEYPFSKRFGWVNDRNGFTWQLMFTDPNGDPRPFVIPALLFTQRHPHLCESAINFYLSLFDGRPGMLIRHANDADASVAGSVMFADFQLEGQWFAAMDSGGADHGFTFNEAVSLSVACKDQGEIDELWSKLSAVPEAEQCGWCKDQFGVSWQVVPSNVEELMQRPNAFKNLMQMKKLVIADF